MRTSTPTGHTRVALGFLFLGVLSRLLPHPPNVSPVAALAIFGAATLPGRWALVLPLGTLMISDLLLGWHDVVPFTWSAMLIAAALGWWLRSHLRPSRILLACLLGSLAFFLVTNFGVWLIGAHGTAYPKTAEGLWMCYVAALPFFRNTLLGDLVYTAGVFSIYAWATGRLMRAVPVPRST